MIPFKNVSAKKVKLTADRAIALYHLRVNPKNRKQTTGTLKNFVGDCCALGLIAEAFDIPCTKKEMIAKGVDSRLSSSYDEIETRIGIEPQRVYRMNDQMGLTFSEIADRLEKIFEEENEKV